MNAEDDNVLRRAALKAGKIVDKGRLGSDTMRDAFEAEAIKRGYPWSDNQSVRQFNAYAWEVWQAAQSRPAQAVDSRLSAQAINDILSAVPDIGDKAAREWSIARAVERALCATAEPLTDTYVQRVPDKCDRIIWRNAYYDLPLKVPQPVNDAIEILAAPAPPVPASVQEIMRLMGPYIEACVKFNNAHRGIIDDALVEIEDAFAPLEAALTALVEKNHELQFSLDGVNATRPAPNMDTMQAIYAKAWMRAADWANRHDLHSDVGSPAYLKDMAIELAEFADVAMDGVNAMRRPEWQPIETAPKDGTEILLYAGPQTFDGKPVPERNTSGHWLIEEGYIREHRDLDGRWIGQNESDGYEGWMSWDGGFTEENPPTHWMPRPAAPSGNESNGGAS